MTICGGPRVTTFYHTPNTCANTARAHTRAELHRYICQSSRVAMSQHKLGYGAKFVAANGISAGDEMLQRYSVEYVSGNELEHLRACSRGCVSVVLHL